jgi:hypothetical protein
VAEQHRRTRPAVLAAAVTALLLVTLASVPVEQTEAGWNDRETATATLSTMTVPSPVFASCKTDPGPLGLAPTITVLWSLPAGYAIGSARYVGGPTVATMTTMTGGHATSTVTPGNYSTVFSGPVLSGLLGGQASVGILVEHTSTWTSKPASASGAVVLLGLGASCSVNP